ncbi:MAG: S24 family peptidase [Gemmatimonadaceae bacterium]|nr:S24 family peptidase [Gemmatimonadaceae bacterium]
MTNHRRRDDAAPSRKPTHESADATPEIQADAIFRLAADWAFEELLPDDPRNVPFFEWFAKEARARQTSAEGDENDRHAEEFAKRMTRRWARETVKVDDVREAPPRRVAPVETTAARALEAASAERRAPYLDLAVAAGEGRELWDEICTEWIDLPEGIPPGRHLAIRVSGESMMPFLHEGDTILVRVAERGETPEPGRVVVARRPESGYVVKRLGRVRARAYELVSLNPAFPRVRVPRGAGSLLGTVVLRWCPHSAGAQ